MKIFINKKGKFLMAENIYKLRNIDVINVKIYKEPIQYYLKKKIKVKNRQRISIDISPKKIHKWPGTWRIFASS